MSIPDETLMAYADGELEPAQRAEVEAAIASDPALARRVEQHQALRRQLGATFDPVLLETVPERLVKAALAAPREATVTDLRRVRAARAAEAKGAAAQPRRTEQSPRAWSWFEWGAMAASLAVGAIVASLFFSTPGMERIVTRDGQLVAQSDLQEALSNQLASAQPETAPVRIGVSFRSAGGELCRTFMVKQPSAVGGLACRQGDLWRVQVLASGQATADSTGGYRPASADMPPAVRAAVEAQMQGDALDAAEEVAAREKDWQ